MSWKNLRKAVLGPTSAEVDEDTRKRIEKESLRGSKAAAAKHLAWCEREHERNPSAITKASLEQARRNMS